ncbi:MAG: tetratricopeptide (TPR) repeat protein [Oceanospirillaceae bacterium]|jgi:tetratricopeptide (TPR) repeat protein
MYKISKDSPIISNAYKVCALILLIAFLQSSNLWANNENKKATLLYLSKTELAALKKAQQTVAADKLENAVELLLIFNQKKVSKLAKALSLQMLGSVYQTQSEYPKALAAYEKALSYNELSSSAKVALFAKVHKLNYFVKEWEQSVFWWLKWEKKAKPKAEDYLLISDAYRQQEKWKLARKALLTAIKLTPLPPHIWYKRLLSYEEKLPNSEQHIQLLTLLIEKYPNTVSYWLKLAGLYRAAAPERSTALLYSAFYLGILTHKVHILWLAKSLAKQGNYMQAAQILQTALEAGYMVGEIKVTRLMVGFFSKAKAYETALTSIQNNQQNSERFSIEHMRAKLYFKLKKWQFAYKSALAIKQQNIAKSKEVQLILGVSSANLQKFAIAKEHLNNVMLIDPNNQLASYWLRQL